MTMENAIKPLAESVSTDGTVEIDMKDLVPTVKGMEDPEIFSSSADGISSKTGHSVSSEEMKNPSKDVSIAEVNPTPMEIVEPMKVSEIALTEQQQKVISALVNTPAYEAFNAAKLNLLYQWKSLQLEAVVNRVIQDTTRMVEVAKKFGSLLSTRQSIAFIDNEADDLFMLMVLAHKRRLPKQIITFGGYTYLRQAAVKRYTEALCLFFEIPEEERPIVHMGLPYRGRGARRPAYDDEEGKGYLSDSERKTLKEQSLALESELKTLKDPSTHDAFKSGMEVTRNLLDAKDSEATSIIISTSPVQLARIFAEDPERSKKAIISMSSPYRWETKVEKGDNEVSYKTTFNSGGSGTVPSMNSLLESEARFLGVGGGVSQGFGLRRLVDAAHGSEGTKQFEDVGLKGLEETISTKSPATFASILAHAADNITGPKMREWESGLKELDAYKPNLATETGTEEMDTGSSSVPSSIGNRRPFGEIDSKSVPKMFNWPPEQIKTTRESVARYGKTVNIDTAAADLYMLLPALRPDAMRGSVSYTFQRVPDVPGTGRAAGVQLDKFVPDSQGQHFAVTDTRLDLLRNTIQETLSFVSEKAQANAHLQSQAMNVA